MDELTKWVDASLDMIRAGFATGADSETRTRAAMACLALHGMLSPAHLIPIGPAPVAPAEPDPLDAIMARLAPFMNDASVGFRAPTVPGAK